MERTSRRWLRFFVIIALGGIGIGVCLAALVPGVQKIAGSSQYSGKVGPLLSRQCAICGEPTTVYDSNRDYLDTLGLRDRRPVQLSDVPKTLISSVIVTEDRTFYDNPGVDVQSMIRAFLENVDKGGVEQGGSTITQQLIKNRVLKHPKQDLNRKVKEAALAIRLNEEWSKNHILEEYLNTVYFGQGSYGVKAAAERYFDNTPLAKIDLADSVLLAGLIKNPEGDNPFTHGDRAYIRRAQVIATMLKQHRITKAEADEANRQPLPTVAPPAEFRPDNYYVAQVRDLLTQDAKFGLGATDKEREDKLNLGGLRVFTAYDPRTEFLAQSSINSTIPVTRYKVGMAAMDPSTGDVKAIVAGPNLSFNDTPYNYAVMPVNTGANPEPSGRQPGSTFKAIVLATALENGYSVKDSVDGTSPCTLHITGKKFNPLPRTQNAEGGGGVMSLRRATEDSVNCAYFRLGAAVGLDKIVAMAKRLGITHPINAANYSLSIGSSDGVSPLDMATAFSTFASDGVLHTPVFITKVEDSNGKVIFKDDDTGVRAPIPQIARTVTDVLRGVITDGTGTRAKITGHVAAGKTGTTDSERDVWFVGYTPQLVTAVWMGNPLTEEDGMRQVGRFGPVFGGTWPALLWHNFMTAADGQPEVPFAPPDQKLWPYGKYVSENGRGKTSSSSSNNRYGTSSTTKPRGFFGGPPASTTPAATTPSTTPAATTPTSVPTSTPGP